MNMDGGRILVPRSAVQRIQSMILEGTLKPGDRLPAQRELSEQFGISRASLREALSVLETLGLVRVEVGRGVFVLGPGGDAPPQAKWRFADRYSPLEVYETRLMLEPRAAGMAARNARAVSDRVESAGSWGFTSGGKFASLRFAASLSGWGRCRALYRRT